MGAARDRDVLDVAVFTGADLSVTVRAAV